MQTNINEIVTTVTEKKDETVALVKARVGDVTAAAGDQMAIVRYDTLMAIQRLAHERPLHLIAGCLGAGFFLGAALKMLWRRPSEG